METAASQRTALSRKGSFRDLGRVFSFAGRRAAGKLHVNETGFVFETDAHACVVRLAPESEVGVSRARGMLDVVERGLRAVPLSLSRAC